MRTSHRRPPVRNLSRAKGRLGCQPAGVRMKEFRNSQEYSRLLQFSLLALKPQLLKERVRRAPALAPQIPSHTLSYKKKKKYKNTPDGSSGCIQHPHPNTPPPLHLSGPSHPEQGRDRKPDLQATVPASSPSIMRIPWVRLHPCVGAPLPPFRGFFAQHQKNEIASTAAGRDSATGQQGLGAMS